MIRRSGDTITVQVGGSYALANYRLSSELEPAVRSWFRRRRWRGVAAALLIFAAGVTAGIWLGSSIPFLVTFLGVIYGWTVLSGNTPRRFTRDFPKSELVGPTGRPASMIQSGLAYEEGPNDTVEVRPFYTAGASYRIPAGQVDAVRRWHRRASIVALMLAIPATAGILMVEDTLLMLGLMVALVALSIWIHKVLFRRSFPDAEPLSRGKSFLAVQAEHPMNRRPVTRLILVGILTALMIWGFALKGEITLSDLPFAALVLALTGYTVAIAVLQFRNQAGKRKGAPD